MNLNQIPVGAEIFIDSNIFIYHFVGLSEDCKTLLKRCRRKEIIGYSSITVLSEVLHRLMVAEAIAKGFVSRENAVRKLKANPQIVKKLSIYQENVASVKEMGIRIFPFFLKDIENSQEVRNKYGLMTNDSLIVSLMMRKGITNLVTSDDDFDCIQELNIYKPSDIP